MCTRHHYIFFHYEKNKFCRNILYNMNGINADFTLSRLSVLMARIALFVIYVWFGFLKVVGQSPASPLVSKLFLHLHMSSILPITSFIVLFGLLEMTIGILFIIPGLERYALTTFAIHIFTTALPLFLLPSLIWTHTFIPTLEGQYIIKNLALIACAVTIASSLPRNQSQTSSFTSIIKNSPKFSTTKSDFEL